MMTELIPTIDEIVKYGLQPGLKVDNRDKFLEKNLIKIYSLYFEIQYEFDDRDLPEFDNSALSYSLIRENIESNFKDFGYYNLDGIGVGDAIDDLTDITSDLLKIKWRITNNSLADGLWYFELIFYSHTQQHILNLLNFMKNKNG